MSKPKIPTPTPVVERQAYKSAPTRASLASPGGSTRPSMGAAVAAGLANPASTTRRVLAGGDQQLMPALGGQASSGAESILTDLPTAPIASGQPNPASRAKTAPWLAAVRPQRVTGLYAMKAQ